MSEKVISPNCGRCGGADMLTMKEWATIRDDEGYYCKQCVVELTTPPKVEKSVGEPLFVTQMRSIVKDKGIAGVTDENGKNHSCDMLTASIVTKVWDALSVENREKLSKLPFMKFIKVCWGCVK